MTEQQIRFAIDQPIAKHPKLINKYSFIFIQTHIYNIYNLQLQCNKQYQNPLSFFSSIFTFKITTQHLIIIIDPLEIQNRMNQLSHGERIHVPVSIVRSVSFDKIREGSLSSRNPHSKDNTKDNKKIVPLQMQDQQNAQNIANNKNKNMLCQQLLSKKLGKEEPKKYVSKATIDRAQQIKKQMEQKEMKECTFKPKITKNSESNHRTLEQFLRQQKAFQSYKYEKVNEMRQVIKEKNEKQNTFQPNIQNVKKAEPEKRALDQVYDRLYEESKKLKTKQQQPTKSIIENTNRASKNNSIQKIKSITRKNSQKSISSNLIQSKRLNDSSQHNTNTKAFVLNESTNRSGRQQTHRIVQKKMEDMDTFRQDSRKNSRSHRGVKITKNLDLHVNELYEKKMGYKQRAVANQEKQMKHSTKNKELYIKKILREISSILTDLQIASTSLSYIQMSQILQKMNFLDDQTNLNDRKYSYQLWQMLQGDVYQSCNLLNLIRIIFALLGCADYFIIQQCLSSVISQNNVGPRLVLSEKQSKSIKQNFEQLYLNRLRKGQYTNKEPKPSQFTHKPYVSKQSAQMAEKYRQRILQQSQQLINKNLINFNTNSSGQLNHIDLLLLDNKRKELKIQIKREEVEKERRRIEDQSMQGTLQIRENNSKRQTEQQQPRYEHLYELGKNLIRNKKEKQRTFVQPIPKQCTFHPNIKNMTQAHSTSNNNSSFDKSNRNSERSQHLSSIPVTNNSLQHSRNTIQDIKDFDKSIFRMYEGRRIRQNSSNHHQSTIQQRSNFQKSNLTWQQSSKNQTQQHEHEEQQLQPILYLSISMEGVKDIKIPVYEGDKIKNITEKVKYMIGEDNLTITDDKLQQILKLQIEPTLEQMGGASKF